MAHSYLFESERLTFRNWENSDLDQIAAMNANAQVMEYFPKTLSKDESKKFLTKLQEMFESEAYTYFAVELKGSKEFIGFIGMAKQEYQAEFNPSIDIGWRLMPSYWGKGYAYEGAKTCLEYGFNKLNLKRIIAVCSISNYKSEKLMQKLDMTKMGYFKHPYLKDYPKLESCCWYELKSIDYGI